MCVLHPQHRAPFSRGSGSPADVAVWARSLGLGRCCSSPGLGSGRDPSTFAARQAVLPARLGPGSARSRRPVRCWVPAEPSPILPLPGFTSTSLGARRLPQRSVLPLVAEGLRGLGMGKARCAVSCPRTLPAPLPGLGTGGEAGSSWHFSHTDLILLRLHGAMGRFSITASLFHLPAQESTAVRGDGLGHAGGFLIPGLSVLMGCSRCLA